MNISKHTKRPLCAAGDHQESRKFQQAAYQYRIVIYIVNV